MDIYFDCKTSIVCCIVCCNFLKSGSKLTTGVSLLATLLLFLLHLHLLLFIAHTNKQPVLHSRADDQLSSGAVEQLLLLTFSVEQTSIYHSYTKPLTTQVNQISSLECEKEDTNDVEN